MLLILLSYSEYLLSCDCVLISFDWYCDIDFTKSTSYDVDISPLIKHGAINRWSHVELWGELLVSSIIIYYIRVTDHYRVFILWKVILDKAQNEVNQYSFLTGDKRTGGEKRRIKRWFNGEKFLNLQSIMMSFVGGVFHSHLLLYPFYWWRSMCLCSQRQGRKKEPTAGEKKRENREEFAFTASLFKVPPSPPPPGRKGDKRKEIKERERIWGNKRAWLGF